MNRNKRVNFNETDIQDVDELNKNLHKFLLEVNKRYIEYSDNDIENKWKEIKNDIITFYNDKYIDILSQHIKLFEELNLLYVALIERNVYDNEELIKQMNEFKNQLKSFVEKSLND